VKIASLAIPLNETILVIGLGGVTMVTEQQIKDLAYAIWEEEGRPEGKDIEHYFQARQILEERQVSSPIELASPPIAKFRQRSQTPQQAPPPVADVPPGQYHHRRYNRR
jgi:hypothetical protein